MRVTIKDIARLAQVSTGTVDRVLHSRGEVSEKTREKIENIVKDLNYEPDILAKTLSSKKDLLFAVIMPVSVNEDFWSIPMKGIEKALSEVRHFGINIKYYLYDQMDKATFFRESESLLKDLPDAVLFAPVFQEPSCQFAKKCTSLNIPVVLFNSNLEDSGGAAYIGQDSKKSGEVAARLLWYGLNDGDRVIIANPAVRKENHNHLLRRELGFRKFFTEHSEKNIQLITANFEGTSGMDFQVKISEALSMPRVKAIFVTNSRVHLIASFLKEKGIKDKIIIGFDLLPINTTLLRDNMIDFLISQKPEEQGYRGIMTLYQKKFLEKEIPEAQFIPIDIITNESIDFYEYR